MTDIPELTARQLARAVPARVRKRLIQGRFESGDDIAALRRFVGLTQPASREPWALAYIRSVTGSRIAEPRKAPR